MRVGISLARLQLRHGWRSLVAIAVLVAIGGGLTLAGIAGARRTRSAVDRMTAESETFDVLVNPDQGDESALDYEDVAALPMVEEASRVHGALFLPAGLAESAADLDLAPLVMITDGGFLYDFGRPVLSQGRMPARDSVDEIYVEANFAEQSGLAVGDRLPLRAASEEQSEELWEATSEAELVEVVNRPGFGTTVEVTVVGIGRNLEGIVVDEGFEPLPIWAPISLAESLDVAGAGFWGALVRLSRPDQADEFISAVNALVPDELIVYATRDAIERKIDRAVAPSTTALLIFATVAGGLGLLVVGQAVSRRFRIDAGDNEIFAVLGANHWQRFVCSMTRLSVVAVTGAGAAVVVAWLLSGLMPVGPASRAELHPGLDFDSSVLLGGGALVVVAVLGAGAWPAWRAADRVARRRVPRSSALARWASSAGASAPVTTGIRFALEPGRRAAAVPTRATILGAATAVTVAAATLVFSASVDRVVENPRFYGTNFDVQMEFFGDPLRDDVDAAELVDLIRGDPGVVAAREMRISEVSVSGSRLTTIAFSGNDERIGPTIAQGRAPSAPEEIALGANTMRDLEVDIGDVVSLEAPAFEGDATVVGRVVLPGVGLYEGSDRTALGTGGVVSVDVLGPRQPGTKAIFVADLAEGETVESFADRMAVPVSEFGVADFSGFDVPSDIRSLSELRSLPIALAALLIALVAAAVVHAIAIAVRQRARELATLRAIGARRKAIRQVGMWQGLTIGGSAVVIGLPLGVVVGRSSWTVLADAFGTLAEPVVSLPGLVALVLAVIIVAAAVGLVPAQRGLQRTPSAVLREE
jgi:hypothetical protein